MCFVVTPYKPLSVLDFELIKCYAGAPLIDSLLRLTLWESITHLAPTLLGTTGMNQDITRAVRRSSSTRSKRTRPVLGLVAENRARCPTVKPTLLQGRLR